MPNINIPEFEWVEKTININGIEYIRLTSDSNYIYFNEATQTVYSPVTQQTYNNYYDALSDQNLKLRTSGCSSVEDYMYKYNETTQPVAPELPAQPVNSKDVQQVVQDKARENYVRQELEDAVKREQDIVINKDGKNYTAKYDKDSGLYLYEDENGFIKTTTPEDVVIDVSPDDPIAKNAGTYYDKSDFTDPSFTSQRAKERNKLNELDKQINQNETTITANEFNMQNPALTPEEKSNFEATNKELKNKNAELEDQKKAINKSLNGAGLDEKEQAAYKEAMKESDSEGDNKNQPDKTSGDGTDNTGGVEQATVQTGEDANREKEDLFKETKREWPQAFNTIFGLPPIGGGDKEDDSDMPMAMSDEWTKNAQDTIFKNSFPLLKIKVISLNRPENTSGAGKTTSETTDYYKFAIQNQGSITYNISNTYEASSLESVLTGFTNNAFNQYWQLGKSSRFFNSTISAFKDTVENMASKAMNMTNDDLKKEAGDAVNKSAAQIKDTAQSISKSMKEFIGEDLTNNMISLGGNIIKSALGGQKIDIPNIWTGSSAPVQQNVSIILHCVNPNNDDLYYKRIILPLKLLFMLSTPYSKQFTNSEANENNDIITYENPPYIEAIIDNVFETKIGAISNLTVDMPYNGMGMAQGGRPCIVNVKMTIVDLYEVMVWADNPKETSYAPNPLKIINNLKEPKIDSIRPKINEKIYAYHMISQNKESNSSGFDNVADIAASIASAAGDELNLTPWQNFTDVNSYGQFVQSGLNTALSALGSDSPLAVNENNPFDVSTITNYAIQWANANKNNSAVSSAATKSPTTAPNISSSSSGGA